MSRASRVSSFAKEERKRLIKGNKISHLLCRRTRLIAGPARINRRRYDNLSRPVSPRYFSRGCFSCFRASLTYRFSTGKRKRVPTRRNHSLDSVSTEIRTTQVTFLYIQAIRLSTRVSYSCDLGKMTS